MATLDSLMCIGDNLGHPITITSGCDGKHMETSYHYKNKAFDIRTNDLTPEQVVEFLKETKHILGDNYDVVLEKDHIHIEPSPRSQYA